MTAPSYFTLTAAWQPDTNKGALFGPVTVQMVTAAGAVLPIPSINGIVVPSTVLGQVINGVLCDENGNQGLQLVANTPALNLTGALYYTVTPTLSYYLPQGATESVTISPITFAAPTSTTTVDLSTVTPAAGIPTQQLAATVSVDGGSASTVYGPGTSNNIDGGTA